MTFCIAALLAMLSAGYTGFLVLHVIGLSAVAPWADVLITGLAIGGGTKPLHDLIANLREGKVSKQAPSGAAEEMRCGRAFRNQPAAGQVSRSEPRFLCHSSWPARRLLDPHTGQMWEQDLQIMSITPST
jgi:hypothetical protein